MQIDARPDDRSELGTLPGFAEKATTIEVAAGHLSLVSHPQEIASLNHEGGRSAGELLRLEH
jgi:hypothetical protein